MSLREKFEQEKKNTLKERYEQEELLKEELLLELNEKAGAQMTALMLKIEKIFAPYYAKLPNIKEGISKAKLESMKLYSQGLLGKIGNFLRPDSNTVKMKDVELFLSAMTSLLVLMPQILVNAKSASEKPDEQLNKVMDENEINIIIIDTPKKCLNVINEKEAIKDKLKYLIKIRHWNLTRLNLK